MARKKPRVTLIYNDKAGDARHSRDVLVAAIRQAGYAVHYVAYRRCDLAKALDRPAELVAVAGGDGPIAKVANLAAGRRRRLRCAPPPGRRYAADSAGCGSTGISGRPRREPRRIRP
jgi:diacylglycerol kinase family enzyme